MALGLVNVLVGPIAALLDKLIPDKDAREKMAHDIASLAATQAHEIQMGQIDVNKQEAAHQNLFVAGWRPFIGWSCGIAMALNFLIIPLVNMYLTVAKIMVEVDQGDSGMGFELLQVSVIDLTVMMPVLMGMLGLGAMRTFEKAKGVAREK